MAPKNRVKRLIFANFGAVGALILVQGSGCGEVLPAIAVYLDLKDSTLIGVEEVLAVRNTMGRLGANLAGSPPGRADAAAMHVLSLDDLETEFYPVTNARRTSGY